MKTCITLFALLSTAVSAYEAKPSVDNLDVYNSKNSSAKIATVSTFQQVDVVSTSGAYSKISFNGKIGWVESQYLRKVSNTGGTNVEMSEAQVKAPIDGIEGFFLPEDNTSKITALRVDRSFAAEMGVNLDKENLERKQTEFVKN